jgi:phosphatidate cytidylyltransferase
MKSAPTSQTKTMPQRVFFGTLALLIVGLVFWLDARIAEHFRDSPGGAADLLSRGSILPLFIATAAIFGAIEMIHLFRAKGAQLSAPFVCSLIVMMVLLPWLWPTSPRQTESSVPSSLGMLMGPLLATIFIGSYIVLRRRPADSLRDLGALFTTVFYVGFLLSFPVAVRCNLAPPGADGAWVLLTIVLIIKASDIGAYFTGSFLGRHKLIPAVSPGKSVEGMVGGLLSSGLVAVVFIQWTSLGSLEPFADWGVNSSSQLSDDTGRFPTRVIAAFTFGIALSIIGQMGDLIESCFKRDAGIKDSGYVMPRLGGILDLIDSPLLAIPMGWLILTLA